MREEFFETLKKQTRIILGKEAYYREKISQKRGYIDKFRDRALETGILPYTFDYYTPKIPEVHAVFFCSIIEIHGKIAYYSNFHYLEDENPDLMWAVVEMDSGSSYYPYYFLFSEHYLQRFAERNPSYKRYTGNIKEAIILDVFGGAGSFKSGLSRELVGQFLSPAEIMGLPQNERLEWIEEMKKLSGVGDKMFDTYFNLREDICITKTVSGYGVYRMTERRITMITWLSEDMLGEKQRSLFHTLTQKVLEARSHKSEGSTLGLG